MYSKESDWSIILEDIQDYYAGTTGSVIAEFVHSKINEMLRSFGRRLPISTNVDGEYPWALREWESLWTVYYLLKRRTRGESPTEPEWIRAFWEEGSQIAVDIKEGKIALEVDRAPFQCGIQPATAVATQGSAIFHSNWQGYEGRYNGTEYEKTYVVKITSQGSKGELFEAEFKWSDNGGVTFYSGTNCSTSWNQIGSENIFIRWELTGTASQCFIGDTWKFKAIPYYLEQTGENWPSSRNVFFV